MTTPVPNLLNSDENPTAGHTSLKRNLSITVLIELLTKIPLYGFEFLLASLLVIDQYAEWAALGLIYRMAPYAHLGALSYFNKRYPVLLGAGRVRAAENTKEYTNSVVNFLVMVGACLSLLLYLINYIKLSALVVIGGVLVMQVFTYCQAKVRNEGNFSAYCIGLVIFSMMQFFIAYLTVQLFGVMAGVMSTFLAYLSAVIYYIVVLKTDYRYCLPKLKRFHRIFWLGWPPFMLTISSFMTQTSDRIALIMVNDDTKLAFYGFFSLYFQIGIVAINSLGKVLSPYILHLSGKEKLSSTLSISIYTCYIILALFFLMNFTIILGGNWIIAHYFEQYSGGLLGMYNYATMGILTSLTMAFYPQLLVAGKESIVIKINLIYFCLSFLVVYELAKLYEGYYAYSLGSFLMSTLYSVVVFKVVEGVLNKKIYVVRWTLLFIFISTVCVNYGLMYGSGFEEMTWN